MRTVVHGDDFTIAGTFENIKWLHGEFSKKWKCIERDILGPPGTPDTIQDIRVINYHLERRWHVVGTRRPSCRVSYCFAWRWPTWRQSHTPLAKGLVENPKDAAEFLNEEEATQYKSVALRAAYLAQDRPDLQVATRSLAQGLQRPTTSHMLMLKRVARYLRYRPRTAQFSRIRASSVRL